MQTLKMQYTTFGPTGSRALAYQTKHLTFTFISWFGLLNVKNKNRLLGIEVCHWVVGTTLNDLTQLYKARVLSKARTILAELSHPLTGI